MSNSQVTNRAAGREGPGRNDPCPCGSGRKFKQCRARAGRAVAPAAAIDPLKMKAGNALTQAGQPSGNFSPL
jgi:hypothetical protein